MLVNKPTESLQKIRSRSAVSFQFTDRIRTGLTSNICKVAKTCLNTTQIRASAQAVHVHNYLTSISFCKQVLFRMTVVQQIFRQRWERVDGHGTQGDSAFSLPHWYRYKYRRRLLKKCAYCEGSYYSGGIPNPLPSTYSIITVTGSSTSSTILKKTLQWASHRNTWRDTCWHINSLRMWCRLLANAMSYMGVLNNFNGKANFTLAMCL